MKIEEFPLKKKKSWLKKKYWFPFTKGYNRLLIVLAILILFISEVKLGGFKEDDVMLAVLLVVPFIEFLAYMVIIWVYRGFKELPEKE